MKKQGVHGYVGWMGGGGRWTPRPQRRVLKAAAPASDSVATSSVGSASALTNSVMGGMGFILPCEIPLQNGSLQRGAASDQAYALMQPGGRRQPEAEPRASICGGRWSGGAPAAE